MAAARTRSSRARFFWPALALLGGGLCGATACQRPFSPAAYLAGRPCRPAVVAMDRLLRVTPARAFPDSAAAVFRVADAILACPDRRLHLVVYFHGSGPWVYRRALAAGLSLKDLLVKHGYPVARLSYDAQPAAGPAKQRPNFGVDFQAQRRR